MLFILVVAMTKLQTKENTTSGFSVVRISRCPTLPCQPLKFPSLPHPPRTAAPHLLYGKPAQEKPRHPCPRPLFFSYVQGQAVDRVVR